jgi:hypothetical protein
LFVPPVLSDPCNIIFLMSKKNWNFFLVMILEYYLAS